MNFLSTKYVIMKPTIFILLLMASLFSFGQSIDREVVSVAGDDYKSSDASLSWTLGDVATESITNNHTLNQGFHQGNMYISSIENGMGLDVVIKAYPNPVMDILIIETEVQDKYQIIDIQGEVLKNGIITSKKEEIDFTDLPTGIYFLQVDQKKTHKIIKQ